MLEVYKNHLLDKIRKIRKQKGIKSQYIALRIGISQGDYSKLENGQKKNIDKFIPLICKVLEVQLEDLLEIDSDKTRIELENQKINYERLINESHEKDKVKDDLILSLQREIELWKAKCKMLEDISNK